MVTIGVAAVVAPLLSLATPAQAAAGDHGGGGPASARALAPFVINSATFAGYQATVRRASVTSAARFRVPALSCTSAYLGIAPVAGVLVTFNTNYSSAFLFTGCHHGRARYFPAVVINGRETNYPRRPVRAGNLIQVTTKVTTTHTTVSVTDVTTSVTTKRTGAGANPSAAYIGDSDWVPNGLALDVPSFGTLGFTHCSINGKPLARWRPAKYQRKLLNTVQITTGRLTSGGSAFRTHFQHS